MLLHGRPCSYIEYHVAPMVVVVTLILQVDQGWGTPGQSWHAAGSLQSASVLNYRAGCQNMWKRTLELAFCSEYRACAMHTYQTQLILVWPFKRQ